MAYMKSRCSLLASPCDPQETWCSVPFKVTCPHPWSSVKSDLVPGSICYTKRRSVCQGFLRPAMKERAVNEQVNEPDATQGKVSVLQRVRCRQCQAPLIQLYQGELPYTVQAPGADPIFQHLPAYSYRTLTDPTPLLTCPRCGGILSPTTTTIVLVPTMGSEHRLL